MTTDTSHLGGSDASAPSSGSYGSTSGTDSRGSRPLIEDLMVFSLPAEIDSLRTEDQYRNGDRNSATLAKEVDFRVLLSVLRPGATLDEQDGDARASLQILDGTATLTVDEQESDLDAGDIGVIDAGRPWLLRATTDCALLLTLAWPREKAGV
jgi:quercetin dioxygenase-like cupin family protein